MIIRRGGASPNARVVSRNITTRLLASELPCGWSTHDAELHAQFRLHLGVKPQPQVRVASDGLDNDQHESCAELCFLN